MTPHKCDNYHYDFLPRVFNWKSIFLFLNQNICCGYSKERDGSFEHTEHMFKLTGKKNVNNLQLKNLNLTELDLCLPLLTWYNVENIAVKKEVEYFPAFTICGKASFVSRYLLKHWANLNQAGSTPTIVLTPYRWLVHTCGPGNRINPINTELIWTKLVAHLL